MEHNDDQNKIKSESEVRADYLISGGKKKNTRTRRIVEDGYSDSDLNDYTDDEEYVPKQKKTREWRRNEPDDSSFVVDDDFVEYEEDAKKKSKKKGKK